VPRKEKAKPWALVGKGEERGPSAKV